MSPEELKNGQEYAWKYFNIHAEQRLKTFNFFVMLSSLISGATLTIAKDSTNFIYAAPMGYLLTFLSFIFWKLDLRNKELIKHGENALKRIESHVIQNKYSEVELSLFLNEEKETQKKINNSKFLSPSNHFSYSKCFNWVFFIFGIGGFIMGSAFLLCWYI